MGSLKIAFSVRILATHRQTHRQTDERTDGQNQRVKPLPRFSEIGSLLFSAVLDSENDRNCTHHITSLAEVIHHHLLITEGPVLKYDRSGRSNLISFVVELDALSSSKLS